MDKKDRSIPVALENAVDMVINVASIIMAYIFAVMFKEPTLVKYDSVIITFIILAVVLVQSFIFLSFNLYRPIHFMKTSYVIMNILRANIIYYMIIGLFSLWAFSGDSRDFIVIWTLLCAVIDTAFLLFKKKIMMSFSAMFKKKGYRLRKVIIVGDNTSAAQEFVKQVTNNNESAMMILGYVGDRINEDVGCDKLGSFKDLASILDEYHPNDVIFAIDAYDKKRLIKLVNMCDDRCIKVYFLPVIYGFFKTPRQIEPVGSMPVINIHYTPLDNKFNAAIKRLMDIIGSSILILLTSPIMLIAAIGVKISSPGPVFFKQERVGKMGKRFTMLKFRSMKVNVASDTAWSNENDSRKTKFGAFLRKTSIDELPQFFNVLFGSMSLVGPRPEVPYYVEYFKEIIPLYMVKHYVKPGITGLAQIKGLRGDTSIEERIHEDIEYIENWTLGMDLLILLKTPFKAFNKQEKYVDNTDNQNTDQVKPDDGVIIMNKKQKKIKRPVHTENPENAKGKVLYAASTMSHIDNFHWDYIKALREDGYIVKTMGRGDGADFNVPFEKKIFSSANAACRAEIKKILEKENFDIILINTSLAAFHIRFCLKKNVRPKVINMVHGYLFSKDVSPIKQFIFEVSEKFLAKRTDHIIVMNEWDKNFAARHRLCVGNIYNCKGMGAQIRPISTPVDKLRKEQNCEDKFVMAFVGELSSRKNQEFLIYALNEIKEKIPNAVLWLVGDGLAKDSLKKLASEVDVSESVFLLGRRDNACDFMRACDLYVSASKIEGMPFNVIEAMGCGKTVLVSQVKGHSDLVEDGKSGFIYKLNNKKDFVNKVVAIHDGRMKLRESDIISRYDEYSKENVFESTLEVMKRSFES